MTQAELRSTAAAPDAPHLRRLRLLIEPEVRELRPESVVFCGSALANETDGLAAGLGISIASHVADVDAGTPGGGSAELVVCAGLLEQTPLAELDMVLERLHRISDRGVFQISTCARPLAGESPNCTIRYADWWLSKLRQFFDDVELVATSAHDAVFKTWRSSRLQAPLRTWRRARARAELRRDSAATRCLGAEAAGRPPTPVCLACESAAADYLGDKNGFHIWKCVRCRLLFVNPMPTETEIVEFYSQHPRNDKYRRKADGKYRSARWRLLRVKHRVPGRRFLDIGCSIGAAVAAARAAGFDATGIDLDPQSIQFARDQYSGCRFLQTTAADLTRAGEKFDLIFCTEVIEHVVDPQAFVDDLRALLNPGGIVWLTTPHATHVRNPRDILSWASLKPPEHVVLFGRKSMAALFERRGFRILSAPLRWKTCLKVVARRAA